MSLEEFECLLDEVTNIGSFALRVINLVTKVVVDLLKHVHHRENLAVVWHESLANSVGASHKCLEDFEGNCDNFTVTGV